MTKKELTSLKELVINILETCPPARDSDDRLYVEVCKAKNRDVSNCSFEKFMLNRNKYGVPSYGSVGRARRKAQAEREDLVGISKRLRKNLEQEYIDFALS
jgi:hypothetical protein